eukprot:281435_1
MTNHEPNDTQINISYHGTIQDRSIIGELCVIGYVLIWITSLLCPIILGTLLWKQYYFASLIIIVIILISYSPKSMDKYLWSLSIRNACFWSFSKYYENISLGWVKNSKPFKQKDINDENKPDAIPTLMCVHPHGIFCQTWALLFCAEQTVETTFMFANALYISPFFRLLCRFSGIPSSCDKVTMSHIMKAKKNCAIIPGGFHDASLHSHKIDRIYLKKRKGFIKYAIKYGYSLTPVFGFGEKDTFYNIPGFLKLRLWLNNYGIPGILPIGRWFCPVIPKNKRLHIVVDTPLLPPKLNENETITNEMINKHHEMYVKKLENLYDKYSKIYYGKQSKLEIW